MMNGDSFDEVFARLIEHIDDDPEYICSPRGQKIKEILGTTIVLWDPRARVLANAARDANYGFAVGEFFWYLSGKQDLGSMLYYNKRMGNFSDDGFTLNSAYGFRTRVARHTSSPTESITQWEACRRTLLADPDSRRAIMVIGEAGDFAWASGNGSKDVPCTLSLQFFIRDNELHLHAAMRSNDAMWGLTYDLFSFTLLQEVMLLELREQGMSNLQLGRYVHTAGSMHVYEHHFEMAKRVCDTYVSEGFRRAAPMEPVSLKELFLLGDEEEALRTGKIERIDEAQYSGGTRWLAERLNEHRRKRDAERGR